MMKNLLASILTLSLMGCTAQVVGNSGADSNSLAPFLLSFPTATLHKNVAATVVPTAQVSASGVTYRIAPADLLYLPTGLSMNPYSGILSGTPTSLLIPAKTFRVIVTVGGKNYEAPLILGVDDAAINFSYSPVSSNFKIGDSVSLTPILSTGFVQTWSAAPSGGNVTSLSSLGLSINPASGVVSGTLGCAVTPGSYQYTVSAANPDETKTFVVTLVIAARTPITLFYAGSPFTFVRQTALTAISPTVTGPSGLTYSISPALSSGLSFDPSTGTISGTPSVVSMPTDGHTVIASEGICSNSQIANISVGVDERPLSISLSPTSYSFLASTAITPFSATVNGAGSAATSWSITPVAPATNLTTNTGLSFSTSTGQFSGTPSPSAIGTTTSYDIQAFNSYKSSNIIRVAISVASGAASLAYSYTSSPISVAKGDTVSASPTVTSGGATSWAVAVSGGTTSTLSDLGLSFNAGTGSVTGTVGCAIANGTYNYQVTASNMSESVVQPFVITVTNRLALNLNYAASSYSYSRGSALTPINPDAMSTTNVNFTISPALPSGFSINNQTGVISGSASVTGYSGNNFTVTATDTACPRTSSDSFSLVEALQLNASPSLINAKVGDTVSVNWTVDSGGPTNWSIATSGGNTTAITALGLALNSSTGALTGTLGCAVTPGTYDYQLTASNSYASTNKAIQIVVAARTAITLSYAASPFTLVRGTATTTANPTVSGPAGLSYSVSPSLPTGLTLSPATGSLSGTPTVVSMPTSVYSVTASEGICSNATTASINLSVDEKPLSVALTPTSYSFVWGDSITAFGPTVNASGSAAASWTITPVAPATGLASDTGLAFSTLIGQISGTPSNAHVGSTYSYDIQAANSYKTSNAIRISITILARTALTFHYDSVNFNLRRSVTAMTASPVQDTGGSIVSYAVSPSLPDGLSLDSTTGVISGTPTASASLDIVGTSYTVTATDSVGTTGTAAVTLKILRKPPESLSYSPALTLYQYYQSATATWSPSTVADDGGGLTYSVSPTLPGGLTLDSSTGIISIGRVTGADAGPYTMTVTNSGGSLAVALPLTILSPVQKTTNFFLWTGNAYPDRSWSNAGNWTKKSGSSASYPTANTHMAFFDGTCTHCDADIDVSTSAQGVFLAASYSGVITQLATRTLNVGRTPSTAISGCTNTTYGKFYGEDWGWIQFGGTFAGGSSGLTFSSIDLYGGTFTSTSGTLLLGTDGTQTNATLTRCHMEPVAPGLNQPVGMVVKDPAVFNANSGTVSVVAGYKDSTICGTGSFGFESSASGINLNHLILDSHSNSSAGSCDAAATTTSVAKGAPPIMMTTGSRLNVAGDLTLKRGTVSPATTPSIFFAGALDIQCADAGSISAMTVPGPKTNCWRGANISAVGSSDQTYKISVKSYGNILSVDKTGSSVLKPDVSAATTDIRLLGLNLLNGIFRAPTATLLFEQINANQSNMKFKDSSLTASFDHNSGTVMMRTRSIYQGTGAAGGFLDAVKSSGVGPNPLVLNHLIVDLNHDTNYLPNSLDFGSMTGVDDVVQVEGDLTVLDGFLFDGIVQLKGNLNFSCSSLGKCADDFYSTPITGAVDSCRSYTPVGFTFVGGADQYVNVASGAKTNLYNWTVAKTVGSRVILNTDLNFTGQTKGGMTIVNLVSGNLDLNGHLLTANLNYIDTSTCLAGTPNTPWTALVQVANGTAAEMICSTSMAPDFDQVMGFMKKPSTRGVNPAYCYEPEL